MDKQWGRQFDMPALNYIVYDYVDPIVILMWKNKVVEISWIDLVYSYASAIQCQQTSKSTFLWQICAKYVRVLLVM